MQDWVYNKVIPNTLCRGYKDARRDFRYGNYFDAIKEYVLDPTHSNIVNKDAFKVEVIDIVYAHERESVEEVADLLLAKEEFWTIAYNLDPSSALGYDLGKNLYFNKIVGQLYSKSGEHAFLKDIPREELVYLISLGYSMKALASHFKVSEPTIRKRIRAYWRAEGAKDLESARKLFIKPFLRKLIELGYAELEMAEKFFRKDKDIEYTRSGIAYWCSRYLGFTYHDLRYHLYSIPAIINGIRNGKTEKQIAQDLHLSVDRVQELLADEWGQEFADTGGKYLFYKVRDKYLKPLIHHLLSEGCSIREIGRRIGRSAHFVTDFIEENFGMRATEAKLYFQSNYLGRAW